MTGPGGAAMVRQLLRAAAVVVVAVLGCLHCEDSIAGIEGEDIVLSPVFHGNFAEVIWKKGKDKVAEWDNAPKYYGPFKGRAELDSTSGSFTIRNLSLQDTGKYMAEVLVEGEYQYTNVSLEIFGHPAPPDINCTSVNGSLQVQCIQKTVIPKLPVSYDWEYIHMKEIHDATQSVVHFGKNVDFSETITCIILISHSSAKRSFRLSDCPREADAEQRRHTGIIVAVVVLVAIVIGIVLWKKGVCHRLGSRFSLLIRGSPHQPVQSKSDDETANT